jgi:cytochrome-b5 reductase
LFRFVCASTAQDDILVREELEQLEKEFPDRFKLHYTLDRPPADGSWKYSSGFISKEMIQEHCLFNGSSKDTQVFMCGPPPMVKFACLPNLTELGFSEKEWFVF